MVDRLIYIPHKQVKRKKPRRKNVRRRKAMLVLAGLAVLAVGSVALLRMPWWQVSTIEITGVTSIPEPMLEDAVKGQMRGQYAGLLPKTFIGIVSTRAIEQTLASEFPIFEYIHVGKRYPQTLTVDAKERDFLGIACSKRPADGQPQDGFPSCAYVDINGIAYETAPSSSGLLIRKMVIDVPEITKGMRIVSSEIAQNLRRFTDEVSHTNGSWITEYELVRRLPREVRAHTSDGYYIIFEADDNLDNVLRVVKTVLNEEIKGRRSQLEYIDARFGNKVFYKFKSS